MTSGKALPSVIPLRLPAQESLSKKKAFEYFIIIWNKRLAHVIVIENCYLEIACIMRRTTTKFESLFLVLVFIFFLIYFNIYFYKIDLITLHTLYCNHMIHILLIFHLISLCIVELIVGNINVFT